MSFLRPNARLIVSTFDGWSDFIVFHQEGAAPGDGLPWRMRDGRLLRGRTGAATDGLSSPKWIKCDLQSTNSFFLTVAHDNWYRGDIEESTDNGLTWVPWKPGQYIKSEADAALRELAEDNFVPQHEIDLLVAAVVEFGQSAWDGDAKFRNQPKP